MVLMIYRVLTKKMLSMLDEVINGDNIDNNLE